MSLIEVLHKIDKNQVEINSHGKFSNDLLKKINYKLRLDWNYYSNRMEGGTLTKQETRSVMVGNISINNKPLKDIMEMNGHDKAVLEVLKIGKGEKRISEKRIKDTHKAIMFEDEQSQQKKIGEWKSESNEIINYKGEKISFTPPSEVAAQIHDLLNKTNADLDGFFNKTKNAKHPLFIAADFHLTYISIHPFYDGNGRTGRIFTNLILISCGLPVIIIKDEHKSIYYKCLGDIQAYGGNPDLFYEFIGERILESQQLILDAIAGKNIDDVDDIDKEIELLKIQLSGEDFSKSPKNIYEVYAEIDKTVWFEIKEILKKFDDFYLENKIQHFFNYGDEKFETYNPLLSPLSKFEVSKKPRELTIFGYNIYERDTENIKWAQTKFGLKGATKKHKAVVSLNISFDHSTYTLNLSLNRIKIFEKNYKYFIYPDLDEIKSMSNDLGKELIKSIKENTEE